MRTPRPTSPVALFRLWLGTAGTRPPPLDRFLAGHRADRPTTLAVDRLVRRAVSVVATREQPAPGAGPLLQQIRRLPETLLADAARPELPPRLAALRAGARDWPERCAAWGIPPGFAGPLARRAEVTGESWAHAWLEQQDTRPPLWIRVRRPEAVDALRAEGFGVVGEGAAFQVTGEADLRRTEAFRTGAIEVQDRSSQALGALADLRTGQRAWDVCAGRGGKTMQLADALGGKGLVVATDIDAHKLDELRTRAKRAGLADHVRIKPWDGTAVPDFGPEGRRGFDVVLVDAPCSASGTWRRNPDARLRTDPATVPDHAPLQRRLLSLAASALGPRGQLVYGTCSVFVEEDEDVARLDGFTVARTLLSGPPEVDADTLFGAVLTRAAEALPSGVTAGKGRTERSG